MSPIKQETETSSYKTYVKISIFIMNYYDRPLHILYIGKLDKEESCHLSKRERQRKTKRISQNMTEKA